MSIAKIGKEKMDALVETYSRRDQVASNREHVENLVKQNNQVELETLLGKRLAFGTAGLRGNMGPGYSQMNDLVIIQTSQGLASYLLELHGEGAKKQGVIIGHDARHNSHRFALLAALAFLNKGIRVYLSNKIIPTPLIAYGVCHYKCVAGIVVTASHNPKNDNGYKVYFSNGAQILSPHDKRIQEHIMHEENQEPWPGAWNHQLLESSDTVPKEFLIILRMIYEELCESYFSYISKMSNQLANRESDIRITYTTMHGVGHYFLTESLKLAGFLNTFAVAEQQEPNPDFPTVKFPNPEEAGALDYAFETAAKTKSHLILANDPDSDRCAAAVYDPESGRKRVLTGDEIGTILGWWLWYSKVLCPEALQQQDPQLSPSDYYMITTAVSSKFLNTMAAAEKFQFIETLTGFKHMGNKADELINKQNKRVLFAYEEAIGYMCDSTILDKDGISAAVQLSQCARYLRKAFNRTLEQQLDWLYLQYGYHCSLNSYYICREQDKIVKIFTDIQQNYPTGFCNGKFKVRRIRDLNNNYDSGTVDCKANLPCSSDSFMLTLFVDDDITITMRTSGTEPKIKYYSEIVAKLPQAQSSLVTDSANQSELAAAKQQARDRLRELVEAVVRGCLKPDVYNLESAT